MTKLLIPGAAIALLLMLNELWLHAAIFVAGYAGFIELWRFAKRLRRDEEYITMMHRSLNGLRRAHMGGRG